MELGGRMNKHDPVILGKVEKMKWSLLILYKHLASFSSPESLYTRAQKV